MMNIDEQVSILAKGAAELIDVEELKQKLIKANASGTQLVLKLGLDPTAPDIHLGHTVVLRKAKQFQDLGHKVVIIIGDFTGMIGDPSGRSKTRKQLTKEQVLENAETYRIQLLKILDPEKTEIKFNSEWLSKLNLQDTITLCSKYTVTRMLEREDFKNRFNTQQPISIHEFFYPLLQGYDSISIKADIELGGTDQKFNILMGRTLQKEYDMEKQIAIFMPILEGTDGVQKMSKSLGNYIGINEEPKAMYEKAMTIPDELIIKYYELVTDILPWEIDKIKQSLESGEVNPRDVKMKLATEIVKLYHGEKEAIESEEHFKNVFQKGLIPEDIKEIEITSQELVENTNKLAILVGLIRKANFAPNNSEAKRLIAQGGVKINSVKVENPAELVLNNGDILQVGKKNFAKICVN